MLSRFAKLLLVSTSLAPILLTHAFLDVISRRWPAAASKLFVTLFLVVLCYLLLRAARQGKHQGQLLPLGKVKAVETADTQVIGFVITYLLPLAQPNQNPDDPRVLLFVLFILGLAYWNSNAYHFNPLLGLLGYHFYEVATDEGIKLVLVSRRSLHSARNVSSVVRLTEYVVIEHEEPRRES